MKSHGVTELVIGNKNLDFSIVGNDFPIAASGILGIEFCIAGRAVINYATGQLQAFGKTITLYRNPAARNKVGVVNINTITNSGALPYLTIKIDKIRDIKLLIDTGAEVSLMKNAYLYPREIKPNAKSRIRGIGASGLETMGYLNINGVCNDFHIVPPNFPIPGEGILGSDFLTEAEAIVDFQRNIIKLEGREYDFTLSSNDAQSEGVRAWSTLNNPRKSERSSSIESLNLDDLAEVNQQVPAEILGEFLPAQSVFMINTLPELCETLDTDHHEIVLSMSSISDVYELNLDPPDPHNTKDLQSMIKLDHLKTHEREHALKLINENRDIFYMPGEELPGTDVVMHQIPTTDDAPVNARQYSHPHALREEIDRQVKELFKGGIIRPSSSSFGTALWCVPKKSDSQGHPRWRLVLDFRALNEKTVQDAYPLPDITEIFDQVGGARYYTVLDLASGFHKIKMDPRDAHKTAFSTPFGHFELVHMPFGLKNAPATFQRLMDNILRGMQGQSLFVYLDDIVVYANTLEEHDKKIKELFNRLRKANLKLQPEKCKLLKRQVSYLGHLLSEDGLSVDPEKVWSVKYFPTPLNVKNVRQFLGLPGYYRRFIDGYARISKPLTALLQKETTFEWNNEAEAAFQTLKEMLCSAPVLQFPNLALPYNITTDASGIAIGGILSQGPIGKDQPIAYTSRVLRGPKLKYEVYEKESLAMLHSVKKFRSYVYGRKITLVTDCEALNWFKTATYNSRVQKWRFKLSEYDYDIVYKPGKRNTNADALSRNPPGEGKINKQSWRDLRKPSLMRAVKKILTWNPGQ